MADGSAKVKCPHCGKIFAVRLGPQPAPVPAPGPMPMDLADFEMALGGGVPASPPVLAPAHVPAPPAPRTVGGDAYDLQEQDPLSGSKGFGLILMGGPAVKGPKVVAVLSEVMGCAEPIAQGLLKKRMIKVLNDVTEAEAKAAAKKFAAVGVVAKVSEPKYFRR